MTHLWAHWWHPIKTPRDTSMTIDVVSMSYRCQSMSIDVLSMFYRCSIDVISMTIDVLAISIDVLSMSYRWQSMYWRCHIDDNRCHIDDNRCRIDVRLYILYIFMSLIWHRLVDGHRIYRYLKTWSDKSTSMWWRMAGRLAPPSLRRQGGSTPRPEGLHI